MQDTAEDTPEAFPTPEISFTNEGCELSLRKKWDSEAESPTTADAATLESV